MKRPEMSWTLDSAEEFMSPFYATVPLEVRTMRLSETVSDFYPLRWFGDE